MTRKTGLKVQIDFRCNEGLKTQVGEIKLFRKVNGKYTNRIGYVSFYCDDLVVNGDWLEIDKYHRHYGYGSILMTIIMGFAQILNKPVLLYATDEEAAAFHKTLGFVSMTNPKIKKKIVTVNKNPKLQAYEWEKLDMIWLPPKLRRKCKIRVYG